MCNMQCKYSVVGDEKIEKVRANGGESGGAKNRSRERTAIALSDAEQMGKAPIRLQGRPRSWQG